MPTLAWLVIVIFVALAAYGWGASGLLPLIARDLVGKCLLEAIPNVVAAHPFSSWRRPFGALGRVAAWLFFGSVLIAVFLVLVVLGLIALTPVMLWCRLRQALGGTTTPDDTPPPRLSPAALMSALRRLGRHNKSHEQIDADVSERLRRRAAVY
jgi:hypothetical protein